MANVSFSGTDLSSLGFSVLSLNARSLAGWKPDRALILGRGVMADINSGYDAETQTVVGGVLSAPVSPWSSHNKASFLMNWNALKTLLDPEEGFKKLIVTGDDASHYRWCRLSGAPLSEEFPVFKRPSHPLELTFDNLEPWWRQVATPVTLTTSGSKSVPNAGKKTWPLVQVTVGTSADASSPHTLFILNGVSVIWQSDETILDLVVGDVITVDCDNLTVTILKVGETTARDAIRAVTITPVVSDAFPVIPPGGTTISGKSSVFNKVVVNYDLITL